jgi:RHS repeat-associated protein
MPMVGSRSWDISNYRYGYQGSEMDNEVKGEGNHYTTEFRQLDPRLGRWFSVDPLAAQFPWQSPYNSMDSNPIDRTDRLGLSTTGGGKKGKKNKGVKGKNRQRKRKKEKETYSSDREYKYTQKTEKGPTNASQWSVENEKYEQINSVYLEQVNIVLTDDNESVDEVSNNLARKILSEEAKEVNTFLDAFYTDVKFRRNFYKNASRDQKAYMSMYYQNRASNDVAMDVFDTGMIMADLVTMGGAGMARRSAMVYYRLARRYGVRGALQYGGRQALTKSLMTKNLLNLGEDAVRWNANSASYNKLKWFYKTAESANEVVNSLKSTGRLPSNYITKSEAMVAGWSPGKSVGSNIPGAQLGGDVFRNADELLPFASGRVWYEADIGLLNTIKRSKQNGTRLLYSSDGLMYTTGNHYQSFVKLGKYK